MVNKMYLSCSVVLILCVTASLQMPSSDVSFRSKRAPEDTNSSGPEESSTSSPTSPSSPDGDKGSGGGIPGPDAWSSIIQQMANSGNPGSNFLQSAAPFFQMFSGLAGGKSKS